MTRIRRWCWSCAAIMWGLYLIASAAAYASDGPGAGLEWRDVALGAVGLVSLLAGALGARSDKRVEKLESFKESTEARISGVYVALAKDHYTKAEIKDGFHRVDASIDALHRRLDLWGVPHAPPPDTRR